MEAAEKGTAEMLVNVLEGNRKDNLPKHQKNCHVVGWWEVGVEMACTWTRRTRCECVIRLRIHGAWLVALGGLAKE